MKLFERLSRRLFIFQIFLLLAGSCAVAYGSLRAFESDLQPDMTRKSDLIARSIAGQFERALEHKMPFERLRGVEDLFQSVLSSNLEILFIAATDKLANHVFSRGRTGDDKIASRVRELLREDQRPTPDGRDIALRVGDVLMAIRPIQASGQEFGSVIVAVSAFYVEQKMSDIFYDLVVVLVVSLLATFELLLLIMASATTPLRAARAVLSPAADEVRDRPENRHWSAEVRRVASGWSDVVAWLRAKQQALASRIATTQPGLAGAAAFDQATTAPGALRQTRAGERQASGASALVSVRMPLFVFFCAEELSRSFFPVYARSFDASVLGLSQEMVISLPMMLFMLVVAFSQPLGGPLSERFGARRLMIMGALAGALGLALTAAAHSFGELLAWRFVTAAGYGLVFVAGQGYVVANTDGGNRAWGLAMFVGSVLAASICGPAIGGMLADGIGFRWTFVVGAGLAVSSALLALYLLPKHTRSATGARGLRLRDIRVVLSNPRFLALVGLGGMPAKIILTGFLYYLAPLFLAQLGNTPSAAGRIMMLYGLMMVLFTPLAARLVDRVGRPLRFVVLGGLVSGTGLLGVLWSASTPMVLLAVVILGLAQAVSITPQLSLVSLACPEECRRLGQVTVIGFFRLFERLGSALGPLLAALALQRSGYVSTMVAIGIGICTASLCLAAIWYASERRAAKPPPERGTRRPMPSATESASPLTGAASKA